MSVMEIKKLLAVPNVTDSLVFVTVQFMKFFIHR
jgi:hypothetical protein